MLETLDAAFEKSGRAPHVVFSGHIHNYQRFTRRIGEKEVVYIVVGTGGYFHLHKMQRNEDGAPLSVPYEIPAWNLTLENYCDSRHGYLRVGVTRDSVKGEFEISSTPEPIQSAQVRRFDSFQLDIAKHRDR